jgi:hypothetical protein
MRYLLALFVIAIGVVAGCGSTPVVHSVETVYRFENLRKETQAGAGKTARDEWLEIRPILQGASAKPIEVNRTGVRAFGSLEIANYECRCVLGSLDDLVRVQGELDALGARSDVDGERVETHLAQVRAVYKSNFVLATVNVAVSGATVAGNRVRIFAAPGEPPVETTANSSGIWSAKVSIVPQSTWIYGVSEDPGGRAPAQYFRINAATRKQERVEEAEFMKVFPPSAQPAPGKEEVREKNAPPTPSGEAERLREQRQRENEEIKRRRAEDEKRRRPAGTP